MSPHHPRRTSTAPPPSIEAVPPAPPLPPQQPQQQQQRYSQAKSAISRVFGIGGKQAQSEERIPDRLVARSTVLTSSNATAVHRTGVRINALSINESGTHALIAGKDIFKTIRVEGDTCIEDANIRAAIRTYNASLHDAGPTLSRESVDIHDVAWAKGTTGNLIAAATYNGPIVLYDLNRLGIEIARLFDHKRQVHRVTFNPHAGHYMLSASQDGTVQMWDIRDCQRSAHTFSSQRSIQKQSEGIRDVKWSPTSGTEFALGTDGGWIQKWDTQMMRTAKVKIAAHASACNTIDWHPDGKHILSAGHDKFVKVWNVGGDGNKKKAVHEIKVPYPLRNARWRPAFQSVLHGDSGVRQCTQLVTSYDKHNPLVHVWDLRRPLLPFRELESQPTAPTDLLWHSQDLLWTVGREGTFTQSDVSFARKVIDKRNVQAFALSPQGQLNLVTQTRRPKPEIPRMSPQLDRPRKVLTDVTSNSTAPSKMARSAGDDTLDDNFLSVALKLTRRKFAPANESRHVNETPPLLDAVRGRVLPLDTKTERFRSARPPQMAARGPLPGVADPLYFTYFAQKYKLRPYMHPPPAEAFLNIHEVFDQNAGYAKLASMYRLSQSWRIVGQLISRDLRSRAERSRRRRRAGGTSSKRPTAEKEQLTRTIQDMMRQHAVRASNPPTPLAVPVQKRDPVTSLQRESTSAMQTPRARPSGTDINGNDSFGPGSLPDIDDSDVAIQLPPRVIEPALTSSRSTYDDANMDGIDSGSDERARKQHLANWKPRARKPYELDQQSGPALQTPPPLLKHDSDESFGVFPPLSSSRAASLPDSFQSSHSQLMDMVSENLKTMDDDSRYDPKSASLESFVNHFSDDPEAAPSAAERVQATGLPKIDTTTASGPDDSSVMPVVAPERPKSRAEISKDMQTLARNNQESFTSDTDLNPNSQDSPADPMMESRTTIVRSPDQPQLQTGQERRVNSQGRDHFDYANEDSAERLLVEDFLASAPAQHGDQPELVPIITMLQRLIQYHTDYLSDAQSLSALLLLILPLLPETSPLPQAAINTTLNYYIEHFLDLHIPETTISTYLTSSTSHLLLAGLNPLMVESILMTYHDQLMALSLSINAALLRRLSYPTFPSVYEHALKENRVSFRCSTCRKPLLGPLPSRTKCESCHARPAPCPICWLPESPYDLYRSSKKKKDKPERPSDSALERDPSMLDPYGHAKKQQQQQQQQQQRHVSPQTHVHAEPAGTPVLPPSLFTSCLSCNHAAHAACLSVWHGSEAVAAPSNPGPSRAGRALDASEGASEGERHVLCPTEGCGCACLSDSEARFAGVSHGSSRAGGLLTPAGRDRKVVDDEMRAGESRAVAGARRSLGGFGGGVKGARSGSGGGPAVKSGEGLR